MYNIGENCKISRLFTLINASDGEGLNMQQTTLSDVEYSNRRRKTRRELFLDTMDTVVPWDEWVSRIRPFYPPGKRGRPPRDVEMMLRMFLMQAWFQLSAEGMEDVINDSYAMRKFMHLDFMEEQVPSSSTLLKFRHLMDRNGLGEKILMDTRKRLAEAGYVMREGKIIDPRLVSLPSVLKEEVSPDAEVEEVEKEEKEETGTKGISDA